MDEQLGNSRDETLEAVGDVLARVGDEAARAGASVIEPLHVVLAILRDPRVSSSLRAAGLKDVAAIRDERVPPAGATHFRYRRVSGHSGEVVLAPAVRQAIDTLCRTTGPSAPRQELLQVLFDSLVEASPGVAGALEAAVGTTRSQARNAIRSA